MPKSGGVRIDAPIDLEITFTDFERGYDYLRVYDGEFSNMCVFRDYCDDIYDSYAPI